VSDIDDLLEELSNVLGGLLRAGGVAKTSHEANRRSPVEAEVSLRVGFLDEMLPGIGVRSQAGPNPPLVDVLDEPKRVKVIVVFPGVRRRDVKVSILDKKVRVQVKKGDTVYIKEMDCMLSPSGVRVVSELENNSVVELTFAKEGVSR
jgi:hypothetical protein